MKKANIVEKNCASNINHKATGKETIMGAARTSNGKATKYIPTLVRRKDYFSDELINEIKEYKKTLKDERKYFFADYMIIAVGNLIKHMFHDDKEYQWEQSVKLMTAIQCKYEDIMQKHPSNREYYINRIITLENYVDMVESAYCEYVDSEFEYNDEDFLSYDQLAQL